MPMPGHRHRQPGHEAGDGERPRRRVGEHLLVRAESRGHDSPPCAQGSRLWVITPQLLIRHRPASQATHLHRTRRSCWSPSAAPSVRRRWCRSWRTSPAVGAFPANGWPRSASTTSCSAARARSTISVAGCSPRCERIRRRGMRAAALLGQPQLDALPRRRAPCDRADGHRRVLAVVTSAYPSYSSCRQYRENLYDAAQGTQVQIDRIRHYANHPGFVAASVDATLEALDTLGERARRGPLGLRHPFHPDRDGGDRRAGAAQRRGAYVDWHRAVAAEVTRRVGQHAAGAPTMTWSTARGPVRRASRGWSRTSTTTCVSSRAAASRPWSWCRSASCPTTWR